jgi:two-component system response regulator DctR
MFGMSGVELQQKLKEDGVPLPVIVITAYARQRIERLTPQERQVMDYMLAGLPNKVISNRLGVSLRTVEYRRHDIFEKTETESLPELVRLVTDLEMIERTEQPAVRRNGHRLQPAYG